MTGPAIVIAFAYDRPVPEATGALVELFDTPIGGVRLDSLFDVQTMIPLATKKLTRRAFNRKKLIEAITTTPMATMSGHRRLPRPDASRLDLNLEPLPADLADAYRNPSDRPEIRRGHRFVGKLGFGSDFLVNNPTVDELLEAVVRRWLISIDLRAGAVIADTSFETADNRARCSGDMPGTEFYERMMDASIASRAWGPKARAPEWGTYLTAAHADAIGGGAAIRAAVEPYRILEAGGVVFVQLSPYDAALAPETEAKRQRLEALMAPIVATPLSRVPAVTSVTAR